MTTKKELDKKIKELLDKAKENIGEEAKHLTLKRVSKIRLLAGDDNDNYMPKKQFWSFCNIAMSLFTFTAKEICIKEKNNEEIEGVSFAKFLFANKKKVKKREIQYKKSYSRRKKHGNNKNI